MIGIFGGSGFYRFLDDVEEMPLATPYGPPSAPVAVGKVEGVDVAFMPRHGHEHTLPPHRINYRANVWAMREVGVRRIVGPSACGSLKRELGPGTFVVCDQFVDRTQARESTFYDGPQTTHVAGADPYCKQMGEVLVRCGKELEIPIVGGGTIVVIGMTQYPEAWLARELELCYANVSLVTDYDVGVEGGESVSAGAVMDVFRENLDRLRALLFRAVPLIGPQPDDLCSTALQSAVVHH
jgi:5'-methylthioadenosine phosphorylase